MCDKTHAKNGFIRDDAKRFIADLTVRIGGRRTRDARERRYNCGRLISYHQ
jgi:hypothetical protein